MIVGFKSEKVQMYVKKCSDHHKLCELLEITYIAFTDELLILFIRSCKSATNWGNVNPTVNGYRNFCSKTE